MIDEARREVDTQQKTTRLARHTYMEVADTCHPTLKMGR